MNNERIEVNRTDAEWQKILSPEQYKILRKHATEKPFSSDLNEEKRHGVFCCVGCNNQLFLSEKKYESGSGWPSFFECIKDAIKTSKDFTLGLPRTEIHCSVCKGHIGHVFNDGPKPTGLRYCTNGVVLKFISK